MPGAERPGRNDINRVLSLLSKRMALLVGNAGDLEADHWSSAECGNAPPGEELQERIVAEVAPERLMG